MSSRAPYILTYASIAPVFATPPIHAGPGSAVLGRATIGRNAWLGALSVIRADSHFVRVGDDFHLGAHSTLHINHDIDPCVVGDRVAVGRNACVHACEVGSDVVIGDHVVILDAAVVEENVVLEAGSTVFPGKRVPAGFLYAGSPAKPVRPLVAGELAERRQALIRMQAGNDSVGPAPSAIAAASQVHPSVFIAATASVRGRLVAGESSSIWYSNDFDAGGATIEIGENTNIQDNTIIRCATARGVSIGSNSAVGHNVILHDCSIGNQCLIGIGSTVSEGTLIGDSVLLAAAARTSPGQRLESGWLYAGSPARKFAPLDDAKRALTAFIVQLYCQYARDFSALQHEADAAR
jgi:carbonic anhydrase/acetyltransferase-like protein (isoleucine patch superfamily)